MPPPPPQNSRRDPTELKSQIARKLGPERAQRYFSYLNRLLGQKLSKSEFDKLCLLTLGRDNIPLHNQLIHLILRNACQAKVPPPAINDKVSQKPGKADEKKSLSTDDWSRPVAPPVLSNGEILSPHSCDSRSMSHRIKDHPTPLGPNGKSDVTAWQRGLAELPTKKQRVEMPLSHEQISVHRKGPGKVVVGEDGGESVQRECGQSNRGPSWAPLGIPFCPVSIGGVRRPAPLPTCANSDGFASSCYSGMLCHTEVLQKRMVQIAKAQDLGGVTLECANLLNSSLDVYLKRLIKSCVELVGARSGHDLIKQPVIKQHSQGKIISGTWQENHVLMKSSMGSIEGTREPTNYHQVSLLDFRVAMELNRRQLGEHWPLLLERIHVHSFEE